MSSYRLSIDIYILLKLNLYSITSHGIRFTIVRLLGQAYLLLRAFAIKSTSVFTEFTSLRSNRKS